MSSVQTLLVKYQPNLAKSIFAQIHSSPWSMLLRSAAEQHPDSRYDILVTNPIATLETVGNLTTITHDGKTTQSSDDPFELLAHYQHALLPNAAATHDLPFIGGAVGFWSYDLGRRIEEISTLAQHDLTCADMAVGLYDWALVVDHHSQQAYVVGHNVSQHYDAIQQQLTLPATDAAPFALTSPWQSNMDKSQYQVKFNKIQDYLKSGDCYQINLAQRFSAHYQGCEWSAYLRLEQQNKAPFSAYIRTSNSSILSISPERFLQSRHGVIETKPIKGTRPRHPNREEDARLATQLAAAEKDQAENLMIVDLLRNDIGRVAKPGSVKVPHLFAIESFPAVHHLVSTVTGTLDSHYSVTDLLKACFPGGSITGAPKVRAMEIIEELEPHRRSVYCGSIGYISRDGTMDTSITIRTLIAEEQRIYAWAGGGIVADSQCDAEYQETLDKLSRILPVLAQH